jgi:hypothetical protein
MWIISQIERKNMTGKLQNDIPHKFFLTRHRTAFHVVYQHFLLCWKRLFMTLVIQIPECEYHQNCLSLPQFLDRCQEPDSLFPLTIAAHVKCFNEEMERQ